MSWIISVDFFIKGSPDRPPSIFLYLIFDKAVLSIVVFVATIPQKIESFTISTMFSIVILFSSGEIFRNNGIFICNLLTSLFTLETKL